MREHARRRMVPTAQSLQLFSTLQRQWVPSKLIVFPDGGHWILKPKDSQVWYQVVLDWLGDLHKASRKQ